MLGWETEGSDDRRAAQGRGAMIIETCGVALQQEQAVGLDETLCHGSEVGQSCRDRKRVPCV
jgi:hypothetical protein